MYKTLIVMAFVLCGTVSAQVKHETHLEALNWMTNGTWVSHFRTPAGTPFTIEEEIRWAETGTAIVFKTKFNGEPQYFGAFFYNSASQTIDFYYDSKDGEFTSGTVELLDNGFKQAFQQASPMNTTKFQMTVLRTGADAYSFEVHKKGSKDVLVSVKYQRQ